MTAGPAWQVNPTTNAPMSDGAPDRKRLEWLIGELEAQREELLRRRDAGQLTDAGLRVLERQLDLEEITRPCQLGFGHGSGMIVGR
jgi:hypothetical protein